MKILFPAAFLLVAPMLSSPVFAGDDDEPKADVVHRTYSLPGPRAATLNANWARMVPLRRSWDEFGMDFEPVSIGADSIIDIITSTVSPEEWEYENRSIQADPRGNLVIAASPEVHAQIEKLLAYLDQALSANTRVQVDVFEAVHSVADLGGTMASAKADSVLQAAVSRGDLVGPTTLYVDSLPQTIARGGGMEEIRFARDVDVEIAQASATVDPVVHAVEVGFEVQSRTARIGSGSALQLVMRMGALLEDMKSLDCPIYREIAVSDKTMERDTMHARLDQPTVGFATVGFTTYLPDGQDLLMVCESDNVFGRFARVVRIRATAEPVPDSVELAAGRFAWSDLSLVSMPNITSNDEPKRASLTTREDFDGGSLAICPSSSVDTDWVMEYVRMQLPDFEDREGNLLGLFGEGLAMFSDAESHLVFRKALAELTATLSKPGDVDLRMTSRDGGTQFGRLALSTVAGSPVWFSLGGQQWNIIGYDVEVAQSASINDPHADAITDGMIASFQTRPHGQDWRVDFEAAIQVQRSKPDLKEVGAWPGTVALTRAVQANVIESFRLTPQTTRVFGDLDPTGKKGLHLHVKRN